MTGEVRMSGDNQQTWFEGKVYGLAPGPHGFHVHEKGEFQNIY